jgi:hypothetical protein
VFLIGITSKIYNVRNDLLTAVLIENPSRSDQSTFTLGKQSLKFGLRDAWLYLGVQLPEHVGLDLTWVVIWTR